MALTEEECRELCQAVRDTGLHLAVGFNRRFAPLYVETKKRLAGRTSPAVINCRMNSPGISGSYWMADPSIGGAILGEACHFVDLMYWLLESEPVEVSAYCLPTGKQDPIGENNIVASFRFADGSIGNLTYCTVGSRTSGGERVEAFAQGIGIIVDSFKRLTICGTSKRKRSDLWARKGYDEQMRFFFRDILEDTNNVADVMDGTRATICCRKILESASTFKPIRIKMEL